MLKFEWQNATINLLRQAAHFMPTEEDKDKDKVEEVVPIIAGGDQEWAGAMVDEDEAKVMVEGASSSLPKRRPWWTCCQLWWSGLETGTGRHSS
jgi:hypothetical protein